MKYIVYLTKNLINSHIYIGVHGTENPDAWDYYLGDGCFANKPSSYNHCKVPFAAAVHKYGPKNFKRSTLKVFDTEREALELESILVDENFIRRRDTYNITLGGGKPPVLNKKVYQYDLNGNFIQEWFSITNAISELGLYKDSIPRAIAVKRSLNGYYWSFEKFDILDITDYKETTYKTNVLVYNQDSQLLNTFESIADAGRFYDIDPKAISSAICENTTCYGMIFIPVSKTIDEFFEAVSNRQLVNKTKVYKYDINGNFICEYNSIKEAHTSVGLKTQSSLLRSIKTKGISGGYRWSYFKVNNILKEDVPDTPQKPKRVGQYNENDELIKIWDIEDCKKLYPNFRRVCRGARKKAYGYKWKYIEE